MWHKRQEPGHVGPCGVVFQLARWIQNRNMLPLILTFVSLLINKHFYIDVLGASRGCRGRGSNIRSRKQTRKTKRLFIYWERLKTSQDTKQSPNGRRRLSCQGKINTINPQSTEPKSAHSCRTPEHVCGRPTDKSHSTAGVTTLPHKQHCSAKWFRHHSLLSGPSYCTSLYPVALTRMGDAPAVETERAQSDHTHNTNTVLYGL